MRIAVQAETIIDVGGLGRSIRSRRRALGLTQRSLAGLCGVGERFISELERGKETAEVGRVLRVLQRLGFDVLLAPRGSRVRSEP